MNTSTTSDNSSLDVISPKQFLANGRIHYMDNLRAYAMLLGIIFHAALAYSPLSHETWLTADTQQSIFIDIFAWFSHLFRMPIFFLIAGFFMHFLIAKRGIKAMFKNRARRILLPFIIFWPLVSIAIIASIGNAMESVENLSPILALISEAMSNPSSAEPANNPVTTAHLWFLYYLAFFYIVVALLHKIKIVDTINQWMNKYPMAFLGIFPLIMVPALLSQPIPHPAPESFIPELWAFGFYGIFFFLGFCLFSNRVFLAEIQSYWPFLLGLSVGAYIWFFQFLPESISVEDVLTLNLQVEITGDHILATFLEAYIAFFSTFAFILIGRQYLNIANKFSRYIADASYWIYIIHLPLLMFIQFKLLDVEWNLWIEFILSNIATIGIGLITYALFVRWTFIGKLLNGKKRPIFKSE